MSFQLPFAVIPLVKFTNERAKMGVFANSRLTSVVAWVVTALILFFNAELLWLTFRGALSVYLPFTLFHFSNFADLCETFQVTI